MLTQNRIFKLAIPSLLFVCMSAPCARAGEQATIDDTVLLGLAPEVLATLGVDGIETLTVLDRVSARQTQIDQLTALRTSITDHKRDLRDAQVTARSAASASELSQAEAQISAAQAAITSATAQAEALEATLIGEILLDVAEPDWAATIYSAEGVGALLPAEYRLLELNDQDAAALLGALGRERSAQASGSSLDTETTALLASYRSDSDVSQAIAWRNNLTLGVEAAFASYVNQP